MSKPLTKRYFALPTSTLPPALWLGGSGVCPSLTAKGPCNRLRAIFELPVTRENTIARLLAVILVLLIGPGVVCAASPDKPFSSCGATTAEVLDGAQRALKSNDPASDHAALVCVVDALKQLTAQQAIVTRGNDGHSMLHAPALSGGAGKK